MADQVSTTSTAAADRRAAQKAAIVAATDVSSRFETMGGFGTEDIDGLQELHEPAYAALAAIADAFAPRVKSPKERITLAKAAPADVAAYFGSTGLTRKELAAAAGVSTSVIATVQNAEGDRWSEVTFAAKREKIDAWMLEHRAEIDARVASDLAAEAARQAAIAAKLQRAQDKAAPKAATPKAPKASAKSGKAAPKAGRPSAAARQANRKSSRAVATA